MATPPVGWTKLTTYDDCALRVTSGTLNSGGATPFTATFTSKTASGTRNMTIGTGTGLVSAFSHQHPGASGRSTTGSSRAGPTGYVHPPSLPAPTQTIHTWPGTPNTAATGAVGGGGSHTHPMTPPGTLNGAVTGNTRDFAVNYVDVILGQRD